MTERKLVADLRSGSTDAFERLLDRCERDVYNVALRMVGRQDAEDVAQEALVEICNSVARFQGRSSLSTWVYRVAANVCLAHRRKKLPESSPSAEPSIDRLADPSDGPAEAAVKSETGVRVQEAIALLPEKHRDVVVLHELHGLTYRECSQTLGCPVGTVKSRLSNAFVRLRDLLADYAPAVPAAERRLVLWNDWVMR